MPRERSAGDPHLRHGPTHPRGHHDLRHHAQVTYLEAGLDAPSCMEQQQRTRSPGWRQVLRSRYPGWRADVASGLVGGVLASIVVLMVLTWKADWVAERTLGANPTCAAPRGLQEAEVVKATAEYSEKYYAANVGDDASDTMWIPPLVVEERDPGEREIRKPAQFVTDDEANVLTLHLKEEAEIRLVCVVNGATLWFTSYQNWGRVRTVEVWGAEGDDHKLGILQSLGSDDFPNAQLAARNLGTTDEVHIALVDSYAGQRVETFNPIACLNGAWEGEGEPGSALTAFHKPRTTHFIEGIKPRYEPGCILEPKAKAGLAEVYVYVEA
jgi:hypothetical protein